MWKPISELPFNEEVLCVDTKFVDKEDFIYFVGKKTEEGIIDVLNGDVLKADLFMYIPFLPRHVRDID